VAEFNQHKADYNAVFNSDAGKRVLADLLSFCHVLEAPDVISDTNIIVFKAGRRDVAMYILQSKGVTDIQEVIE